MKHSKAFTKVFLSAPQLNPSNSGKKTACKKFGNYVRPYNKTIKAKTGKIVKR